MSTAIASISGRRVWDSRGRPTVEAEILLSGGARRPRHRACRCVDRLGRGARPARRRRAVRRLRRDARRRRRQWRDRACAVRRRCSRPAGSRPHPHRSRRHAAEGAARRQRHHRRVDGRDARRGGGRRATALGLCRGRRAGQHSRARNPDFRWRRACRPARRHPGFPGHVPHGAGFRHRDGADRGGLPRRRRAARREGASARCRRRGRLVAFLRAPTRKRSTSWSGRSNAPATRRATRFRSRSTSRRRSSEATAATGSVSKGASSTATGSARCWWTGSSAIRSCRSRTRSPRTTAKVFAASPPPSATGCRSSATTCW